LLINVNSNDDVSSNLNSWNFFDDEISFFNIDFETTFFLKLFSTCFRIDILSYYFSSLFLNICNEIAQYVTQNFFSFFLKKSIVSYVSKNFVSLKITSR
jgi:hypothetical protein